MKPTDQLRKLPSVDAVLQSDRLAMMRNQHGQRMVAEWARGAIANVRRQLLEGTEFDSVSIMDKVIDYIVQRQAQDRGQSISPVINATGIILHTNLGRSPLADAAIARVNQATGYASVEMNLDSGRRSKRGERVASLLAQLTGAEDAVVVNNCAAATMLVLQTLASGREVIVSRGQLVEIGGGFRLPDVFRASGVHLREIGTTNRTYLKDYESAITDQTAALIRVHRSNFFQGGFVTEPSIGELAEIERTESIALIDDLGSGCICDLSPFGIHEPTVNESVRAGADLTLFSGDKLFGGPQAGIIVGKRCWLDPLRTNPMIRALRVDKLTLAALEATTEIHLAGNSMSQIPILRKIATDVETIRQRCQQLVSQIGGSCEVEIIPCPSQVGGGSAAGATIDSFGVKINVSSIDQLASLLRMGDPAVQGRITDDSLVLDLRTVEAHEIDPLAMRIADSIATIGDRK